MESFHHMSNIRWSGPQLRKKSLNHGKRSCLEHLESGLEVEHLNLADWIQDLLN